MPDIFAMTEGAVLRITTALVTLFVGIIIAKLAGKITKHILEQAEINRLLKESGIKAIDQRIAAIAEYTIYIFTALLILQELGLTRIVLTIVIVFAAAILTITLLISIRNVIPNLIHGIRVRKAYKDKVGKEVKIGYVKGKLKRIGPLQSIVHEKEDHYITHTYTAKQLQANSQY